MGRMEKVTPTPTTQPTATIETVTKRTEQVPAAAPAVSGLLRPRTAKIDPNDWFKNLSPDDRNDYVYYIYRLDPNVAIIDPNLDDRARGSMLDKLTPADIEEISQGAFLDELKLLLKKKGHGGGKFQLKVVHRKAGTMMHNCALIIEGDPILSKREAWTGSGLPPGAGSSNSGGDSQFIPIIMRIIDEKLSGITQRREDPGAALSEVMKARKGYGKRIRHIMALLLSKQQKENARKQGSEKSKGF